MPYNSKNNPHMKDVHFRNECLFRINLLDNVKMPNGIDILERDRRAVS